MLALAKLPGGDRHWQSAFLQIGLVGEVLAARSCIDKRPLDVGVDKGLLGQIGILAKALLDSPHPGKGPLDVRIGKGRPGRIFIAQRIDRATSGLRLIIRSN